MSKGKVYLIGAGPGDPGLLTLKAQSILQKAEIVIYDYLVNISIIRDISCEKIYVGKKGGQHSYSQSEINQLLVEKAHVYKNVVRLKGGDPCIFGRGGEEAEELARNNILFEIVPGVSSFYAAATYAGIPLTHRDFAQSFEVITGHRRNDTSQHENIVFPCFSPHKTYVFIMGMKNLGFIISTLIKEKNFPSSLPAAIIYKGTFTDQQVVTSSLKDIVHLAEAKNITAPSIIVIGQVVMLRNSLQWYEKLPLAGKKIVVTRTREQASKLSQRLYELGAEPVEFPVLEIQPEKNMGRLHDAIRALATYEWIIFTSQNAVSIFFKELQQLHLDARALSLNKIAVIGPATGDVLLNYGIIADVTPASYLAEGLLDAFKHIDLRGKHILLPCSSDARLVLQQGLEEKGAKVDRVHVYDIISPKKKEQAIDIELIKKSDVITFTSSSTVRNFFNLIDTNINIKCAAIGPITEQALREYDKKADIIASDYTIEGLVDAIVAYYKR